MDQNIGSPSHGIGVFDFFCIGFGAIVGVGWSVSINSWVAKCGGPLPAAAGYLLALIIMVPIALCYCELAAMLPVAGGSMAYAYRAFGEKVSFITGWAAFGAFSSIIPWEAIYVSDILSILFPVIKSGGPLYSLMGYDIYPGTILLGVFFSSIIFGINFRGASASASFQRYMTLGLLATGLLTIAACIFRLDFSHFQPIYQNIGIGSHTSFFGGVLATMASAPFFLSGFETIPQTIEGAARNIKSVSKTVVASVVLACLFYASMLFFLGGAMPWQEFCSLDGPAVSALLREVYPGTAGKLLYMVVLVGALCGLMTAWNGFMMAAPRLLMGMARAGMVPPVFAVQHPKYQTPTAGLLLCMCFSVSGPLLGLGMIDTLTSFSVAGFVLSWEITAYSATYLRKTGPLIPRPYNIPGGIVTTFFASAVSTIIFILLFVPQNPIFIGRTPAVFFIIWQCLGLFLFNFTGHYRKKTHESGRTISLLAKSRSPKT